MSTLSNWQCDRADAAGASFKRHKRASRESVEAFLSKPRTTCSNRAPPANAGSGASGSNVRT